MMTTTEAFTKHVMELQERAETGDGLAIKSLSAIALVLEGWRPGDPDPDGGEPVDDLSVLRAKLAA